MLLEFIKTVLLFIDISVFTYTIYVFYMMLYKILSPNYVYIYSKSCVKYYTNILFTNLNVVTKSLSKIGNLDKICNFNDIRDIGNKWVLNKRTSLYDTLYNNVFIDKSHNINNDLDNLSKIVVNNINDKLKQDEYNIRLLYDKDVDNRHFCICNIHKYILKTNNNIVLYELDTEYLHNNNETVFYILYNPELYDYINVLIFDMMELDIEYTDLFDISGRYIKIVIKEDDNYPNKKDIKLLISSYYKDYCYNPNDNFSDNSSDETSDETSDNSSYVSDDEKYEYKLDYIATK